MKTYQNLTAIHEDVPELQIMMNHLLNAVEVLHPLGELESIKLHHIHAQTTLLHPPKSSIQVLSFAELHQQIVVALVLEMLIELDYVPVTQHRVH